jgi:hypothetical protein
MPIHKTRHLTVNAAFAQIIDQKAFLLLVLLIRGCHKAHLSRPRHDIVQAVHTRHVYHHNHPGHSQHFGIGKTSNGML